MWLLSVNTEDALARKIQPRGNGPVKMQSGCNCECVLFC